MRWSHLTDLQKAAAECAHALLTAEGARRQSLDAVTALFRRGKDGIPDLTPEQLQQWVKAYRDHALGEKIRQSGGATAVPTDDEPALAASDLADLRFADNPEAELLAGISQFTALASQRPAADPLPESDRLALIEALRQGQALAAEDRQTLLSILESLPATAAHHPAALIRQFLQFLLPRKKPVRLSRRSSTVRVAPGDRLEVWTSTAAPQRRLLSSMTVILDGNGTVKKCLPFTRPNVVRKGANGTTIYNIRTATPEKLASTEAIAARVIAAVAFVEGQVYGQTGQAAIAASFGWSRARYEYHEDKLRTDVPTAGANDRAAMPGRKNVRDPRRGKERSSAA